MTSSVTAADAIVVDRSNPITNAASMDETMSGVPIVNIAKPTGAGVSANKFETYNVNGGVIINNGTHSGTSVLGGQMYKNPYFEGNSADIVLFEVTGQNKSNISGYTEVFGDRADFILANPNGLSINGAGFINTSGVVLTTGRPTRQNGRLHSFSVSGGHLSVENYIVAEGSDYVDLISKTMTLSGDIVGQGAINAIAGEHIVEFGTHKLSEVNTDYSAEVAIDASQLGAMNAGKIKLISSQKGAGVYIDGDIIALQDSITINVNGDLSYKTLYSNKDINVSAEGDIEQTQFTLATGNIDIDSEHTILINGNGLSGSAVTLNGKTGVFLDASELGTANVFLSAESLALVSEKSVTINSAVLQSGGFSVDSQRTIVDSSRIFAEDIDLNSKGQIILKQSDLVGASLTIDSQVVTLNDILFQTDSLNLTASDASVLNSTLIGKDLVVSANKIQQTNSILLGTRVTINAVVAINTSNTTIQAVESLSLNAEHLLHWDGSVIYSNKDLDIDAQTFVLSDSFIQTDGTLRFTGSDLQFQNGSTLILNEGYFNLDNLDLSSGNILSNGLFSMDSKLLTIEDGSQLSLFGDSSFVVSENLRQNGLIFSQGDLDIKSGDYILDGGVIQGHSDITITSGLFSGTNGGILSSGNFNINSDSLLLETMSVSSKGAMDYVVHNNANFNQSVISSNQTLGISADYIGLDRVSIRSDEQLSLESKNGLSVQSELVSNDDIYLDVETFEQLDGAFINAGDTLSILSQTFTNKGTIQANDITIDAYTLDNSLGTTQAIDQLKLRLSQLKNNDGVLYSQNTLLLELLENTPSSLQGNFRAEKQLLITAKQLEVDAGLSAGERLSITTDGFLNRGDIRSEGDLLITAADRIENNSLLFSNDRLVLHSEDLKNIGTMSNFGDVDVVISNVFDNSNGFFITKQAIDFKLAQVNNVDGTLQSDSDIKWAESKLLNNDNGLIESGNSIYGGSLVNTNGDLIAKEISLDGYSLENRLGSIQAVNALNVRVSKLDNADGLFYSQKDLLLELLESTQSSLQGDFRAENQLIITSKHLETEAVLSAGKQLSITAEALLNRGEIRSEGDLFITAATTIENNNLLFSNDDLSLKSAALKNSGTISNLGDVELDISNTFDNSGGLFLTKKAIDFKLAQVKNVDGTLQSDSDIKWAESSVLNNENGLLQSGRSIFGGSLINTNGDLSAKEISLEGYSLENRLGTIQAVNTLNVRVSNLDNVGGLFYSQDNFLLELVDNTQSALQGDFRAENQLIITSKHLETEAVLSAGKQLSITAEALLNRGEIRSEGDLFITAATTIENNNLLFSNDDLSLKSAALKNSGTISNLGDVELDISNTFDNSNGLFLTKESIDFKLAQVNNVDGTLQSDSDIKWAESSVLNNENGLLQSGRSIFGGGLVNTNGSLLANVFLLLNGSSFSNADGAIYAGGDIIVKNVDTSLNKEGGAFRNQGEINANGALSITAETILNEGKLVAGQSLNISADVWIHNSGQVFSGEPLVLNSKKLLNSGLIQSDGSFDAEITNLVDNTDGRIYAKNDIKFFSTDIENRYGLIKSDESVEWLDSALMFNVEGRIFAGRNIVGGKLYNYKGDLQSENAITLHSFYNNQGRATALGDMTVNDVNNYNGSLFVGGKLLLTNSNFGLNNNGGTIAGLNSDSSLRFLIDAVDNVGGQINSNGDVIFILNNSNQTFWGNIYAKNALSITGATIINEADIGAGNSINISGQSFVNRRYIGSGGTFLIDVNDLILNEGTLRSESTMTLKAQSLVNRDSIYGNGVFSKVSDLINHNSMVSVSNMTMEGERFTNNGNYYANKANKISVAGEINNSDRIVGLSLAAIKGGRLENRGKIQSNDDVTIDLNGDLLNRGGEIRAFNGVLDINAASLTNELIGTSFSKQKIGSFSYKYKTGWRQNTQSAYYYDVYELMPDWSKRGLIQGGESVLIQADAVLNHGSEIKSGGALSIKAESLTNTSVGHQYELKGTDFYKRYYPGSYWIDSFLNSTIGFDLAYSGYTFGHIDSGQSYFRDSNTYFSFNLDKAIRHRGESGAWAATGQISAYKATLDVDSITNGDAMENRATTAFKDTVFGTQQSIVGDKMSQINGTYITLDYDKLKNNSSLKSTGRITLQTSDHSVENEGLIDTEQLSIESSGGVINSGKIVQHDVGEVHAESTVLNRGLWEGSGQLSVYTQKDLLNYKDGIFNLDRLFVSAQDIDNYGLIGGKSAILNAKGRIANGGDIDVSDLAQLNADDFIENIGEIRASDVSLVSNTLYNHNLLEGDKSLFLKADVVYNENFLNGSLTNPNGTSVMSLKHNYLDSINNFSKYTNPTLKSDVVMVQAAGHYLNGTLSNTVSKVRSKVYFVESNNFAVDDGDLEYDDFIVDTPLFLNLATHSGKSAYFKQGEIVNLGEFNYTESLILESTQGSISNYGSITAGHLGIKSEKNFFNALEGTIQAGTMSVDVKDDFINEGLISYDQFLVKAGNDVLNTGDLIGKYTTVEALNNIENIGVISSGELSLSAGRDIINSGQLLATSSSQLIAKGDIFLKGGAHSSYDFKTDLSLIASRDITFDQVLLTVGGTLQSSAGNNLTVSGSVLDIGVDAWLEAGNDVIVKAIVAIDINEDRYKLLEHKLSSINVGGGLTLKSGRDVVVDGAELYSSGNLALIASGDIKVSSVEDYSYEYHFKEQKKTGHHETWRDKDEYTKNLASFIHTSGNMVVVSEGAIDVVGSTFKGAGAAYFSATDGLTMSAAQNRDYHYHKHTKNKWGSDRNNESETLDLYNVSSEMDFDGSLTLLSDGQITFLASDINSKGLKVDAKEGLYIGTLSEFSSSKEKNKKAGWFSSEETTELSLSEIKDSSDLLVEGDADVSSGEDIVLQGSNFSVLGDAKIEAENDIIIMSDEETEFTDYKHVKNETVGFSVSNTRSSVSLNKHSGRKSTEKTNTKISQKESLLLVAGSLGLKSGNDTTILGSDVVANKDIDVDAGGDILVLSAEELSTAKDESFEGRMTVSQTYANSWVETAYQANDTKNAIEDAVKANTGDTKDEAKATSGKIKGAQAVVETAKLAQSVARSATTAASFGFYAATSVTVEGEKKTDTSTNKTGQSSSVRSVEGNVVLDAEKTVTIMGSDVQTDKGDIVLSGKEGVSIRSFEGTGSSQTNTKRVSSTTQLHNTSKIMDLPTVRGYQQAGVTRTTLHENSHVNAAGTLTVITDKDVVIEGAVVEADVVDMTAVGGKVTVSSKQNTVEMGTEGNGYAVGMEIGYNEDQEDHQREWVDEQTRVIGRSEVKIKAQELELNGAVIAHVDGEGKMGNNLEIAVETATVRDIMDKDEYYQKQFSAGVSFDGKNTDDSTDTTDQTGKNRGGRTSVGFSDGGYEKEQINRGTIGAGAVTVGEMVVITAEEDRVSGLNRDVEKSQELTKDEKRGGFDVDLTVDNELITDTGKYVGESVDAVVNLPGNAVLATQRSADALLDLGSSIAKNGLDLGGAMDTYNDKTARNEALSRMTAEELMIIDNPENYSVKQKLEVANKFNAGYADVRGIDAATASLFDDKQLNKDTAVDQKGLNKNDVIGMTNGKKGTEIHYEVDKIEEGSNFIKVLNHEAKRGDQVQKGIKNDTKDGVSTVHDKDARSAGLDGKAAFEREMRYKGVSGDDSADYVYTRTKQDKLLIQNGTLKADAVENVQPDMVINVQPESAAGNGHVSAFVQNKKGTWFKFDQGIPPNVDVDSTKVLLNYAYPEGISFSEVDASSVDSLIKNKSENTIRIDTTKKQDGKIFTEAINKYLSTDERNYHLWTNNCVDAVQDIAKAGDVKMPIDFDPRPNEYFKKLKKRYDK